MSKILGLNPSNVLAPLKVDANSNLKVIENVSTAIQVIQDTIANGAGGSIIDCRNSSSIRLWGNNSTLSLLTLQYASENDNGVYDWQFCDTLLAIEYYGQYQINKHIPNPPEYIRIYNQTGASQQYSLKIKRFTFA
tara:strand:- start:913 stop:1320 length:408 start_codon:yes stop_codon:yes gene_type:complete